jgi:hypothetical protein
MESFEAIFPHFSFWTYLNVGRRKPEELLSSGLAVSCIYFEAGTITIRIGPKFQSCSGSLLIQFTHGLFNLFLKV